jgi:hypothetical protein
MIDNKATEAPVVPAAGAEAPGGGVGVEENITTVDIPKDWLRWVAKTALNWGTKIFFTTNGSVRIMNISSSAGIEINHSDSERGVFADPEDVINAITNSYDMVTVAVNNDSIVLDGAEVCGTEGRTPFRLPRKTKTDFAILRNDFLELIRPVEAAFKSHSLPIIKIKISKESITVSTIYSHVHVVASMINSYTDVEVEAYYDLTWILPVKTMPTRHLNIAFINYGPEPPVLFVGNGSDDIILAVAPTPI